MRERPAKILPFAYGVREDTFRRRRDGVGQMLVFWILVALAATVGLVAIGRALRRAAQQAAENCRHLSRVEAVLTLDDELLVSLTSETSAESRWLHSQLSVPAVVMLARWRDASVPIHVSNDELDTVLRPATSLIGLRFRRQTALADIEHSRPE